MSRRVMCTLSLVASLAGAQELGLDLSDEPEAPTRAQVPDELKPVLAVLSVTAPGGDAQAVSRAELLEDEIQERAGEQFRTIVEPSVARRALGRSYVTASSCLEYACIEEAAKTLNAHRVLRATVLSDGATTTVTVHAWHPQRTELLVIKAQAIERAERGFIGLTKTAQAQKDRELLGPIFTVLDQVLAELSTPLGKVIIANIDEAAVVTIDRQDVLTGPSEQLVQPGTHLITVTLPGFDAWSQTIAVKPAEVVQPTIRLVATSVENQLVKQPALPPVTPFFARPGVYVTALGVVAGAIGLGLGASAQSIKVRAENAAGEDPLPVTRAEAKAAQTNAILANVLMASGAAAAVAGVTWVVVTLPPPPPSSPTKTGPEDAESVVPSGASLSIGGVF